MLYEECPHCGCHPTSVKEFSTHFECGTHVDLATNRLVEHQSEFCKMVAEAGMPQEPSVKLKKSFTTVKYSSSFY